MPLKQPRILAGGWVGRGKAILPRLHHRTFRGTPGAPRACVCAWDAGYLGSS